ncbi:MULTISPECIES: hypothetical protein [Microbulbifer]|nr:MULTISPECIES: hypothetical protein [Microbulbifer]
MGKRLLYRREDRVTVRHIFIWLECLTLAVGTLVVALILFA